MVEILPALVPEWSAESCSAALRAAAERGNGDPIPRNLGLCINSRGARGQRLDALLLEIELLGRWFDRDRDVLNIDWQLDLNPPGAIDDARLLLNSLSRQFHLASPVLGEFVACAASPWPAGASWALAEMGFLHHELDLESTPHADWSEALERWLKLPRPPTVIPSLRLPGHADLAQCAALRSRLDQCNDPCNNVTSLTGAVPSGRRIPPPALDWLALGPGSHCDVDGLRLRNLPDWPAYLGSIARGVLPLSAGPREPGMGSVRLSPRRA